MLASCSECSLAYRFSYSALRGRGNKDSRMSRTFFRCLCKSFYLILSDLRYSVLIPWSTLLRSPDWVVREVSRHVYNKQQRRLYDYKCMPQQQIKINIPQVFMRVKTLILTLKRAQGKKTIRHVINYRPGREGIPYERGGYARRKFWIKPLLKGDQSRRGPTFFWPPKAIILNFDYMNRVNKTNWKHIIFKYFFECNPKRDFTAKYKGVLPRTP